MRPAAARAAAPPRAAPRWGVRVRAARVQDVDVLGGFIAAYTSDGTLLPRTRANLMAHLRDFRLAWDGDRLVGCGALQVVDRSLAEVRSLAVDPAWRGQGLGSRLLRALVRDARRLGVARVFCLTRRVSFFARTGFEVVPMATFPHKIWNDCRLCPRRESCDEVAMQRFVPGLVQGGGGARPRRT